MLLIDLIKKDDLYSFIQCVEFQSSVNFKSLENSTNLKRLLFISLKYESFDILNFLIEKAGEFRSFYDEPNADVISRIEKVFENKFKTMSDEQIWEFYSRSANQQVDILKMSKVVDPSNKILDLSSHHYLANRMMNKDINFKFLHVHPTWAMSEIRKRGKKNNTVVEDLIYYASNHPYLSSQNMQSNYRDIGGDFFNFLINKDSFVTISNRDYINVSNYTHLVWNKEFVSFVKEHEDQLIKKTEKRYRGYDSFKFNSFQFEDAVLGFLTGTMYPDPDNMFRSTKFRLFFKVYERVNKNKEGLSVLNQIMKNENPNQKMHELKNFESELRQIRHFT